MIGLLPNTPIDLAYVLQSRAVKSSHIRTVSIFEDFNEQHRLALQNDTSPRHLGRLNTSLAADQWLVDQTLVSAFASKSRDFEHLSISFMIDARQFFNSCQQSYTWPLLQSLTLTSSVLTKAAPEKEISALLRNTSLAAQNMPRLETMVLWFGKGGEAGAVIYQRNKMSGRTALTWRGTWELVLSHKVVESWQRVAPDSHHLSIENERVEGVEINSHGDAAIICDCRGESPIRYHYGRCVRRVWRDRGHGAISPSCSEFAPPVILWHVQVVDLGRVLVRICAACCSLACLSCGLRPFFFFSPIGNVANEARAAGIYHYQRRLCVAA